MEQNLNESYEKQNLPFVVGTVGYFNNTGGVSNYQLSLPTNVRKAGLKLFYVQNSNVDTPSLGIGGVNNTLGYIQRISSTAGQNHTPGIFLYTLTSTDATNGYVTIPNVNLNMSICGVVVWNLGSVVPSLNPASSAATATTGFNRNTSINSIASIAMTATAPSIHIKTLVYSGPGVVVTPPSGYNVINEVKFGGGAATGVCSTVFAAKFLNTGETSGTESWVLTSAADKTMTSFGNLLSLS